MNRRAHNVLSAAARCGLLSVLLVLTVLVMHTQPGPGPNTRAMPAVMSAADKVAGSGHAAARDTVAASLSVGDPAAAHSPAMPGHGCEGAGTMCQADRVRAHLRFLDGPRPVHRAGAAPVAADASAAVRPAAPVPTAVRGSPRSAGRALLAGPRTRRARPRAQPPPAEPPAHTCRRTVSSTLFPLRRTLPLAAAAALTAVALTACGSSGPTAAATSTAAATPVAGASTAASVSAHNAADVTFAQSMIPHHRQAVQMAELAATRAASPAVTRLAAAIRAAQDPEITTMTGWLTSWKQPTVTPATGTMPGMTGGSGMGSTGMMSDADMAMLTALHGPAFDREFLTMMTAHHRGAIEMARTEQSQGRYPAAEKLAAGIVAAQTAEIAQMTGLLTRG